MDRYFLISDHVLIVIGTDGVNGDKPMVGHVDQSTDEVSPPSKRFWFTLKEEKGISKATHANRNK